MTSIEKRAAISIAAIYATRMFGLFLIFPIFSFAAQNLSHSTPALIGLALGIYGLTQALFQIPIGALSDRLGRKKVISLGLIIFAFGSLIAAYADSIYGMVLGRALQGSGAIAGALMALCADLSSEQNRSKMMAVVGASIGASFILALIAGPIAYEALELNGLFILTSTLACVAILVLFFVTPDVKQAAPSHHRFSQQFKTVWQNANLQRLNLSIFSLHFILTACFIVVPLMLNQLLEARSHHTLVYTIVMFGSFIFMLPYMILAEKKKRTHQAIVRAIFVLLLSLLSLAITHNTVYSLVPVLVVFFFAFNYLEATLPAQVSKQAPPELKGTAMGVYASFQFIGAFFGGLIGGLLLQYFEQRSIFIFCMVLSLLWCLVAFRMRTK